MSGAGSVSFLARIGDMRQRLKMIALAILILMALCLLLLSWMSQPQHSIRPDQFEQIRLGMSRGDVDNVMNLKEGYMAYEGSCELTLISQEGPDMDASRMLAWYGEEFAIFVWLDDDGRVASKSLRDHTVKNHAASLGF